MQVFVKVVHWFILAAVIKPALNFLGLLGSSLMVKFKLNLPVLKCAGSYNHTLKPSAAWTTIFAVLCTVSGWSRLSGTMKMHLIAMAGPSCKSQFWIFSVTLFLTLFCYWDASSCNRALPRRAGLEVWLSRWHSLSDLPAYSILGQTVGWIVVVLADLYSVTNEDP